MELSGTNYRLRGTFTSAPGWLAIILLSAYCFLLSSAWCYAVPFEKLDSRVQKQWGGWAGSRQELKRIFAEEKGALKENFSRELLKYIGNDLDKHYWCACFLIDDWKAGGFSRNQLLALGILQQGIHLAERVPNNRKAQERLLGLRVYAAIQSSRLGFHESAVSLKKQAVAMTESDEDLLGSWPVLADDARKTFDKISL